MPLNCRTQKKLHITIRFYLKEMLGKRCFSLQVKIPSYLPKNCKQTDIVKWPRFSKLEALTFFSKKGLIAKQWEAKLQRRRHVEKYETKYLTNGLRCQDRFCVHSHSLHGAESFLRN